MKYAAPILLILALGSGIYFYSPPDSYPDVTDISYTLIDGRQLAMKQLRGKPVLVTFWATTCISCIKEIPELIRLYERYSPKGLEIIAVAMPYDRPDHVLEFVKNHKLPYQVALDIDARVVRAFGNVRITPNNFFINANGSIIKQHIGILEMNNTEQWLQSTNNWN